MKNTFISLCILLSVNAQDLVSTNIDLIGSVKFKLDFVERCHAGDLNLIYSELLKDLPERERVILSVEPIQNKFSGSSTLINNSVVIDDPNIRELLKKEVDLDLQIVNGFTGVAGIFICKDGDNDQKCRNNIAKDFNKAMKVYQIPASKFDKDGILIGGIKQREKIEDKIYFFRPVIIKNGKLYSYSNAESQKSYKKMMLENGINDNSILKYVSNTSKLISSIPETSLNEVITLSLPYYNQDNCIVKK